MTPKFLVGGLAATLMLCFTQALLPSVQAAELPSQAQAAGLPRVGQANTSLAVRNLGALSSRLARDATAYGANVSMTIYDAKMGAYYGYRPYDSIEMASMFKIPIIMTLMYRVEQQRRGLTSAELQQATAMIEVSDNTAEVNLYHAVGGSASIQHYMNAIGISDLTINAGSIGYSKLSSASSVRLIEALRTNRVLTPAHCQFILNLMAHVASYQRMGVAATAPARAKWAMKVGYGPGTNGLWLVDSMGTVTARGHSYDIAIYSRNSKNFAIGTALVNHLCADAVQALVGA